MFFKRQTAAYHCEQSYTTYDRVIPELQGQPGLNFVEKFDANVTCNHTCSDDYVTQAAVKGINWFSNIIVLSMITCNRMGTFVMDWTKCCHRQQQIG